MAEETFIQRFLQAFNSYYIPIALPLLVVYTIESARSLRVWHAARQTKKPEDATSGSDNLTEFNAKRAKAIKKTADRSVAGAGLVVLLIIAVTVLQQYLEYKSMTKAKSDEETVTNYYLNLDVDDLSWADILYGTALFFPTIGVISRTLNIIFGMKELVVFRNSDGRPFTLARNREDARLKLPFFVALISIVTTVAAFWFRSTLAAGLVYASIIHLFNSGVPNVKVSTIKPLMWYAILYFIVIVSLVGLHIAVAVYAPQAAVPLELYPIRTTSEVNWAGLFIYIGLSIWPYHIISLCYRFDHYISGSDDALVEPQNVKGLIPGAEDVCGTAVTLRAPKTDGSSKKSYTRFSKYYFNAALIGWLSGYVAVAAAVAGDWLACSWEVSSITAVIFSGPIMAIFIFTTALLRGEVRKIWTYKEDWMAAPSLEDGLASSANVVPKEDEEKVESEKQVEDVILVDVTEEEEKVSA